MRFINRKTLALAGAAAALVAVSSTGTALAGDLIGSADIKDGSIRSVDIKDGRVRTQDLSADTIAKLQGKNGKNGVAAVAAGAGYAGWPTSNPHHDVWAPNSYGETIQSCKAGEVAVGGGFSSFGGFQGKHDSYDLGGLNTDVTVTVSAPYFPGDYVPVSASDSRFVPTQWVVRGFNAGDEPVDVRAWITCAKTN